MQRMSRKTVSVRRAYKKKPFNMRKIGKRMRRLADSEVRETAQNYAVELQDKFPIVIKRRAAPFPEHNNVIQLRKMTLFFMRIAVDRIDLSQKTKVKLYELIYSLSRHVRKPGPFPEIDLVFSKREKRLIKQVGFDGINLLRDAVKNIEKLPRIKEDIERLSNKEALQLEVLPYLHTFVRGLGKANTLMAYASVEASEKIKFFRQEH